VSIAAYSGCRRSSAESNGSFDRFLAVHAPVFATSATQLHNRRRRTIWFAFYKKIFNQSDDDDDDDDDEIGASAMIQGCRVLQTFGLQVEDPQHRLGICFFLFVWSVIVFFFFFFLKNDWGKAEV
jgi:hypothetical protein